MGVAKYSSISHHQQKILNDTLVGDVITNSYYEKSSLYSSTQLILSNRKRSSFKKLSRISNTSSSSRAIMRDRQADHRIIAILTNIL